LSLGEVTFVAPALAILIGLFAYLGLIGWNFPLVILVMVLAWAMASALGFFLSTFILQSRSAFSITSLVATVLTVIPPVFYSIDKLPQSIQLLAYLVPTTNLAILMQSNLHVLGYSASQIELSWVILIAYAAFFLVLASFKARWRQP
jgi:ABC-2 type transport system permease protein